MKVLVIGGTRYMGRIAVQRLIERGDEVTVFSRGKARPEWWDRVGHVTGDRKDPNDFVSKLQGKTFDAVIDTQCFRKEEIESAAAAFTGSIGRYLMVSTGSVYLDGKLDFATHCPFRESDVNWKDLDYTYPQGEDPYGVGKRHCEKWLQENSRVPYTVIRVPAVMGWDDPTGRMWWWVQRALDGGEVMVPMDYRAPFRTLYVEDAAENFLRAIDAPGAANQIYHIATQEILTPERWVRHIWKAAGHEGRIAYVPAEVIQKQEPLKNHSAPLCRPLPYIHDLSKAERDFGFRTTPLAEWIQKTVDWYRDHDKDDPSKGYEHRREELELTKRWREAFGQFVSRF